GAVPARHPLARAVLAGSVAPRSTRRAVQRGVGGAPVPDRALRRGRRTAAPCPRPVDPPQRQPVRRRGALPAGPDIDPPGPAGGGVLRAGEGCLERCLAGTRVLLTDPAGLSGGAVG